MSDEPELPTHVIEPARSSRSKCKACRRAIDKGVLRIGILISGPFGDGYLGHHLACAARRRLEDVEEADRAALLLSAASQAPPQSTSVSSWLRTVSVHVGVAQVLVVGSQ